MVLARRFNELTEPVMTSSDVWYYATPDGEFGPFHLAEMRRRLAALPDVQNAFVWRQGFPDWKRVRSVPELVTDIIVPPRLEIIPRPQLEILPPRPNQKVVIVRRETRKRGILGKLIKLLFIVFNLAMLWWMLSYWAQVGGMMNDASLSQAGKAGAAIGTTIGTTFILLIWTLGAVILGLLTFLSRGNKIIVEETRE